jgi:uncharacterized membrane protein HdeD (DUF308 family)
MEFAMSTATDHASTSSFRSGAMNNALTRNWWLIALRGVLGILFGLIAFIFPGPTILAMVLVFAAYMIVDGIFSIIAAVRAGRQGERWGLLALQGSASLIAAAIAVIWPGISIFAFLVLLAAWAIVMGSLMVSAAFRVDEAYGRLWLALGGFAAVMFGFLVFVAPMAGALVVTWWLGAFALIFGILLLIFAFKLRGRRDEQVRFAETREAA